MRKDYSLLLYIFKCKHSFEKFFCYIDDTPRHTNLKNSMQMELQNVAYIKHGHFLYY